MQNSRKDFKKLHQAGCFVIPNPWDVGTARYLQSLGFRALATTSAGLAFSKGLPDTDWAIARDQMLAHITEIVEATDIPVSADFESGYASDLKSLEENVRLCAQTGVAGMSIEDATGNPKEPLFDLETAVSRIRIAKKAIESSGRNVLLTARAESVLLSVPNALKDAQRRLAAYKDAGADVLYAPGISTREEIQSILDVADNVPVNVLMGSYTGLSVEDLASMGVRRISLGSALVRAAWSTFMEVSETILKTGSFETLKSNIPFKNLNEFFRTDHALRENKGNKSII
ncbi:isocitrate lyase/phosphoenolpyruvate mutase family protein [Leptospira sp. 201903071]|uniref:isocitrate lyase/PEP mutase family protein n=1 Tax=Leptospira ainazelensis TaxID=2810034 RepID=UPI0019636727|nr:isocitrate lyase/phosphoenolpyruvate mutase family protein [Leptospira ainazelensis]MBM9502703.1 isocitrate lyase/phosphoenolpyruvate mutase family protein [Leptospira ainazelensis]